MTTSPATRAEWPSLGLVCGVMAYTMWGFFPVYFKATDAVSAMEILAHRIVWSLPFGLLILAFRRQIGETMKAFGDWSRVKWLVIAAIMMALNWALYIWAIQVDRIFEASLGYYINPLMYVVAGVVFFGESLNRLQLVAIALATVGVSVLTLAGGAFPWVSLTLAVSFTIYGIIRKHVVIGAMPGLFIEVAVLWLPALVYLLWLASSGEIVFLNASGTLDALLLFAGPLTVLPLLCFAVAARRLKLSTLGFLQFIGPTLQFACGLYYGEDFTIAHAICFAFIWIAVIVFVLSTRAPQPHIVESH